MLVLSEIQLVPGTRTSDFFTPAFTLISTIIKKTHSQREFPSDIYCCPQSDSFPPPLENHNATDLCLECHIMSSSFHFIDWYSPGFLPW